MKKKKKKKKRIKFRNIIWLLLLAGLICFFYKILDKNITNIYIVGNNIYNDQYIIDLAGLDNYPKLFETSSGTIKKQLEQDLYIDKVTISKNIFKRSITINIVENKPLFLYDYKNAIVLKDGSTTLDYFSVPVLINQVPDSLFNDFIKKMAIVNDDIFVRISEIKYDPNEVDKQRFLLTMNDGNYVYINTNKFDMINNYIDIIKNFNNKKGVLYLDSGEYFDILDE